METGALFGNDSRNKGKILLLYLAIANPCVYTRLRNSAHEDGKHIADEVG